MPCWFSAELRQLIDAQQLQLTKEGLDAIAPPKRLSGVTFDRIEGMLLGLAIGDALGNTNESLNPEERRARHGEIRDYVPNPHFAGRRVGLPSDDTQMAFWTLEHLLDSGRIVPQQLARIFASREIFGIGSTVSAFVRRFREGDEWYEATQRSAGNGALMRIAPVVLPHIGTPSSVLWEDAILAGAITHNDPSSIAACVAFVGILWELVAMPKSPSPEWWLDTYCAGARPVEGNAHLEARTPHFRFRGPIWRFVDTHVRQALRENLSVRSACDRWYSGAFLLETVPSALFILARHGHAPEEAIVRAVNDTRDNDTIGAIVGAAVGALHGRSHLPEPWISGLAGRTARNDDRRVFDLIQAAKEKWGPWLPASL
jgi:ADP-ribosyl-[dinitrogen reductase] hydrolase